MKQFKLTSEELQLLREMCNSCGNANRCTREANLNCPMWEDKNRQPLPMPSRGLANPYECLGLPDR